MTQKFTVKEKLPSLNEYTDACRRNWAVGAKMKKDTQEAMGWEILAAHLSPVKGRVFVTFTWHERTIKRDKDNVAFAKKFILDALQESGILKDDGNKVVIGFSDYFVYDGKQEVEVTLEEQK